LVREYGEEERRRRLVKDASGGQIRSVRQSLTTPPPPRRLTFGIAHPYEHDRHHDHEHGISAPMPPSKKRRTNCDDCDPRRQNNPPLPCAGKSPPPAVTLSRKPESAIIWCSRRQHNRSRSDFAKFSRVVAACTEQSRSGNTTRRGTLD
jgi:hypothetical protein